MMGADTPEGGSPINDAFFERRFPDVPAGCDPEPPFRRAGWKEQGLGS
jgi:hypothetical protein